MKAMERGYDVYHTLRQTLESGWEVLARQPAVPVLAECAGRLLLGVMLSAARVFDTYSPFALGFVAASGSGLGGFAALVGASLGYLSTLGLVSGLRYVSAAIFIYAVAFAFYDMPVYQKRWFMPLCGGVVGALTGFLYLSELGWHRRDLLAFGALLAGAVMEKSRWLAGLGFFAGGCAAALWNGPAELQVSLVLDMGAAAAIVSALPDRVLPVRARDRPRASMSLS